MEDTRQQARKKSRPTSTILKHCHSDLLSATQLQSTSQIFPGLPRIVLLSGEQIFTHAMAGHFTI